MTVIFHPISLLSITVSVWILLVITFDRYLALSRPLQHRVHDSSQRALLISISLIILAFLFSLPSAFELHLSKGCFGNKSVLIATPTDLRLNENYIFFYLITMNMLFITVGPFIFITILSFQMIYIITNSRLLFQEIKIRRETANKYSTASERTTKMLIIVALKFLICKSPLILVNIWERISGSEVATGAIYQLCVELSNLLVVTNSASDSIVYFRWHLIKGQKIPQIKKDRERALCLIPQ